MKKMIIWEILVILAAISVSLLISYGGYEIPEACLGVVVVGMFFIASTPNGQAAVAVAIAVFTGLATIGAFAMGIMGFIALIILVLITIPLSKVVSEEIKVSFWSVFIGLVIEEIIVFSSIWFGHQLTW